MRLSNEPLPPALAQNDAELRHPLPTRLQQAGRHSTRHEAGARLQHPRAAQSVIQLLPHVVRHADDCPAARGEQAVPRNHAAARRARVDQDLLRSQHDQRYLLACSHPAQMSPLPTLTSEPSAARGAAHAHETQLHNLTSL